MAGIALGLVRSLLAALLAPALVALLVSPARGRGGLDHGDWDMGWRLPPLPPREDAPRVARFVTHVSDWGALATISTLEAVRGRSFADVISFSDGPPGAGSGVPYMYLSPMQQLVSDLQVSRSAAGRPGSEPLKFSSLRSACVLEIRILNPAQMTVPLLACASWAGIPDVGQLQKVPTRLMSVLNTWDKFFASTWRTSRPSDCHELS